MESNTPTNFPEGIQEGGDYSIFGFTFEDFQLMWANNQDEILSIVCFALIFMFVFLILVSKRKSIKNSVTNIFTGMLERDTSDELDLRVNLDQSRNSNNSNSNLQTRNISAAAHGSVHRPVYLPSFIETGDEED